jgi:hypothetical protein
MAREDPAILADRDRLFGIIDRAAEALGPMDVGEYCHVSYMLGRAAAHYPDVADLTVRAMAFVDAVVSARKVLAEADPGDLESPEGEGAGDG